MTSYNYTDLLQHKDRIYIPFFKIEIRGKSFLIVSVVLAILPLIIFMLFNMFYLGVVSFVMTFLTIIHLVQSVDAESGEYKYKRVFYETYMKKVKIVHSCKGIQYLRTRKKSLSDIIDYTKVV